MVRRGNLGKNPAILPRRGDFTRRVAVRNPPDNPQ
jgi:hypothetical protein